MNPMETAPKDGTWVLLVRPTIDLNHDADYMPPAVVAQWHVYPDPDYSAWRFCSYDSGYYGTIESAAGWLPLPNEALK